jgi:transposase-like protein
MKAAVFKHLCKQIAKLTRAQRGQLLAALTSAAGLDRLLDLLEPAGTSGLSCPCCGPAKIYRHVRSHELQRYRCASCGKTFNALSGTPLARLRLKSRWLDYLGKILSSTSVRAAANSVDVHRNTSFRWRHRFLDLAKHDRPAALAGIAEADEMFLLESEKGARRLSRPARKRGGKAGKRGISGEQVCILVSRDRTGKTCDAVTGKGPITTGQRHRHLLPVLARDVLLVTDANAAYRAFSREAEISHACVNLQAGERVRGAIHVQNVNAYHSRFREWLVRFHGVATRYLPNYLGWRWALDMDRVGSPEQLLRMAVGQFNS